MIGRSLFYERKHNGNHVTRSLARAILLRVSVIRQSYLCSSFSMIPVAIFVFLCLLG